MGLIAASLLPPQNRRHGIRDLGSEAKERLAPLSPTLQYCCPHRGKPEIPHRKINQMNALAVAQSYFDAWIHRDADGIIAAFTEGGTYSDPTIGQGISREATADYATTSKTKV